MLRLYSSNFVLGDPDFDICGRVIPSGGGDAVAVGRAGAERLIALIDGAGNKWQASPLAAIAFQAIAAEWVCPTPGDSLTRANRRFKVAADALESDPFAPLVATVVAVKVTMVERQRVSLASAGHPAPFVVGRNRVRHIPLEVGPPLGIEADRRRRRLGHPTKR